MKLQKLLYLLFARYLRKYETPLFANNFEKWRYGPVVSAVYEAFKAYGSESITDFYYDRQGDVLAADESQPEFAECFNEVWNRFGQCTAVELSALTHRPGSAWSQVQPPNYFLDMNAIRNDGDNLFDT